MARQLLLQIASNLPDTDKWFYSDLALPAESYEIQDALDRARIESDDTYREYTIYECEALPMVDGQRLDSPSIEELNFFAHQLDSLDKHERLVLQAVASKHLPTDEDAVISVKDLINLTYGLDGVMVAPGVEDTYDLGAFVIENELNDIITDTPEDVRQFLDKRTIGNLQQKMDGGVFIDGTYICAGAYEFKEVYDGRQPLPTEDAVANYAFRLELMNAPEGDDGIGTDLPTRWLSLPTDVETSQAVANELGAERIEDCVYIGFESSIPQIKDDNFGDMHDFEQLNSLSQMLLEMTPADQVKFKAILSAEEPEKIDEILDIARNLHQYKFAPQVEDSPQFFKNYMLRHMDSRFDPKWLDSLLLRREGDTLVQRFGASITDYGIISKRCGSLYELVPHDEPEENPILKEEFDLIEVNDQTALFSNGRIRACDVPQGLYKYDIRSGETTDFVTIETNVSVNHAATILVKKPFDFNGLDYIGLTDDTSPNFLGEAVSVQEFMDTDYDQAEEQTIKMWS